MIFVVTFAFVSTSLLASVSKESWKISQGIFDQRNLLAARLNALSCVNIAQAKIFFNESVAGDYELGKGKCNISDSLETFSRVGFSHAKFETTIDFSGLDIVSVKEVYR